jgi:CheY-like chemotaxis protein
VKILIVDDDRQVVLALQRILRTKGYDTCHTFTGQGALELIRTEKDIDVIILDINLGAGMSGIDVARQLPRGIPLIVVSGLGADEIRRQAYAGPNALSAALVMLDKPVDVEALFDSLRRLEENKKG